MSDLFTINMIITIVLIINKLGKVHCEYFSTPSERPFTMRF